MADLEPDLDGFSGVMSARRGDEVLGEWAVGMADRTWSVPHTPDTRFGLASGTKTFTALTVLSLVGDGLLSLGTTAREILRDDLPLIADDVTIDHLLTHRSGIGDYLDEEIDALAPMTVPVQQLDSTPAYLAVLDGFETKFRAGERFSYCNGGYVVLAILAERVSGTPFPELVAQRVFAPADMTASSMPRSDSLPPQTATGYKDDGRTNVFELPVQGSGDGGAHSTVGDLHRFWLALRGGRILPAELAALATETVTDDAGDGMGYGRGIWLDGEDLLLSGGDHGVTASSRHDPRTAATVTGLANVEVPTFARVKSLMAAVRSSSR
ncbi:beta-lactamase family protein [Microbacterium sp. NEAU-LLC]|uniref:Beta-lactamase family protein n=1 Tax=Microbacterium helvum TaxID=2773713 RepID=A0ABR8NNV8_9MICO|nr:serine hydrolase domain-containing protein [Microbacterium helvum]MBD3941467.1 beta-lactamase family protein [Microbacterium helvum]